MSPGNNKKRSVDRRLPSFRPITGSWTVDSRVNILESMVHGPRSVYLSVYYHSGVLESTAQGLRPVCLANLGLGLILILKFCCV